MTGATSNSSSTSGAQSVDSMQWAAAMLTPLLLALTLATPANFAAAQAIGGKSVLQYHNSATKAGYYVDAALAGLCCAVQSGELVAATLSNAEQTLSSSVAQHDCSLSLMTFAA